MKQTNKVLFIILVVAMIFSFRASKSISQVTDVDGNVYKTVTIGTQVWTVENLNVEHYRNGDLIPQVQDADKWAKLTTGGWCYYENNSENEITYGKLYNWYAVNDPRGLAPEGWHIPTEAEWQTLIDFLGGTKIAGKKMKSTSGWNENGNGTNESGFSGLPEGVCNLEGKFFGIGGGGGWWNITETNELNAWVINIGCESDAVFKGSGSKKNGFSVRCLRIN
jgi:uncharacterized protein (TIGR02145 family)